MHSTCNSMRMKINARVATTTTNTSNRSSVFTRSRERETNTAAKLVALARASLYGDEKKNRNREEKEDGSTRVIPTNFREIALTSFSLVGTLPLPPVRPGSILRLTQQRISPTRQRILLLVTVSEYRGCRCNFRPRRIYRAREHRGAVEGSRFTAHVFASRTIPLSHSLALSFSR